MKTKNALFLSVALIATYVQAEDIDTTATQAVVTTIVTEETVTIVAQEETQATTLAEENKTSQDAAAVAVKEAK